jgi:D-alanine-D-alanine ligase
LELRDLARIDFRTDVQGVPRIIDVNPLPGLRPGYSDFPISCGVNGVAYDDIIRGLFDTALRRCGLLEPFRLRVAS